MDYLKLEIIYDLTETSNGDVSEITRRFGLNLNNLVVKSEIGNPDSPHRPSLNVIGDNTGFPYGIATFEPLEECMLGYLTNACAEVLDYRRILITRQK